MNVNIDKIKIEICVKRKCFLLTHKSSFCTNNNLPYFKHFEDREIEVLSACLYECGEYNM